MQDASFGGNAIVADDRAVIRDAVRTALGPTWCIYQASSGIEALDFARSTQAGLVILDIMMEPLDGLETAAQIRRLEGYHAVPLVMLTAFDSQQNLRRARLAGADDIIAKPFTSHQLVSSVRRLLAARQDLAGAGQSRSHFETAQDILNVYRKVDSVSVRRDFGFIEWLKAQRRDSLR